jgi:hypothetical protein
VVLLSLAERRRGIARTLAALIDDPRHPAHITHPKNGSRTSRLAILRRLFNLSMWDMPVRPAP